MATAACGRPALSDTGTGGSHLPSMVTHTARPMTAVVMGTGEAMETGEEATGEEAMLTAGGVEVVVMTEGMTGEDMTPMKGGHPHAGAAGLHVSAAHASATGQRTCG